MRRLRPVLIAAGAGAISGGATIGPDVGNGGVPDQATNTLPDGSPGTPAGDHARPGDTGYTAIWNTG